MKVPLSWLKEYLNITQTPAQISDTLTLAGLEVDKVEGAEIHFSGVVVGKVLSVAPHPNADKLRVATVTDGKEEFQVVCGDPSCRAGMKTAFAKIGATLKDENGKEWKIKKSKLRDVESNGMLCTEKELGLSEYDEKIMDFDEEVVVGIDLATLYDDPIFEISLTPNLGHCMCVIGIARELSAHLKLPLKLPTVKLEENASFTTDSKVQVAIEDNEKCQRYACRIIEGVKVAPSPEWLKKWLEASGVRSINNIVDVGNFVMLELGQPLHMFDYDKIGGKKIIVSSNSPHHTLKTLDDKLRAIPKDTLLICGENKPLAVAGVMGGEDSAVSDQTQTILIESAYFSAKAIRRSSKLLNLRTDGSQRHERGIDPQGVLFALDRAAGLLQLIAGGKVAKDIIDKRSSDFEPRSIACRVSRVNNLLGTSLSITEVAELLKRLQIKVKEENADRLALTIPTFRNDLVHEIDIVEEVARLYGYNNIPKKEPRHISSMIPDSPMYLFENEMRRKLMGEGLQECLTCDLISPFLAELCHESTFNKDALINVLHPSSVDQSILRTSLLPGLLQVIKHNFNHQNKDISAYEVGRIHFKNNNTYIEPSMAAIVMTGKSRPYHFDPKPKDVDFFDLKGIVENVMEAFGITDISFEVSHLHNFHPGRQARVKFNDIYLGAVGEVHPSHLQKLDIDQKVYFAELNLEDLYPLKCKLTQCIPISAYPKSERDWTMTLKDSVPIEHVISMIRSVKSNVLESVSLLDIYKSEQMGKDKKNVTFRFVYRDPQKTIALETVEREHTKITQEVAEKLRDCLI